MRSASEFFMVVQLLELVLNKTPATSLINYTILLSCLTVPALIALLASL